MRSGVKPAALFTMLSATIALAEAAPSDTVYAFSNELNSALLHQVRTPVSLYDAAISEMEQMPWDEAYL